MLEKLKPRAQKCIFFNQGVTGYKLWCIEAGSTKRIMSRDVTFNESEMYRSYQRMQVGTEAKKQHDSVEIEWSHMNKHYNRNSLQ